jgi:hypothetical protein
MKSQDLGSPLTTTWVTFTRKQIRDRDIGRLGSAISGIRLMQILCSLFLVPAPALAGKLHVTNFQSWLPF